MTLILNSLCCPVVGASGKPQYLHCGLDIFTKMKGATS